MQQDYEMHFTFFHGYGTLESTVGWY